jgi:ubiquinone/menaquinone biosynthesis C-methylase UbiE
VTVESPHSRLSRLRLRLRNELHPYSGLPLWWYERAAREYDLTHPEIFNPVEQARLRQGLKLAAANIRTGRANGARALDLGCGTGNLTAHLQELGARVVAADVSPFLLERVRERFGARVETLLVNGADLSNLASDSFDLVAVYSVLHHVRDYLRVVEELARVARPGGVVYIDHEASEEAWDPDGCVAEFRRRVAEDGAPKGWWHPEESRWQRAFLPSTCARRGRMLLRRLLPHTSRLYPPFQFEREGDVHVWPWAHPEWSMIEERLESGGCEVVHREDYLLYRDGYPLDVYEEYRDRCNDMRLIVARRVA